MKAMRSTFYDRVEELARQEGMKTADLLRRCGIPYNTFHASRFRQHDPRLATVLRVTRSFPRVRMEWLADGQGEMTHPAAPPKAEVNEEVAKLKLQIERLKELLLEKERRIIELEIGQEG